MDLAGLDLFVERILVRLQDSFLDDRVLRFDLSFECFRAARDQNLGACFDRFGSSRSDSREVPLLTRFAERVHFVYGERQRRRSESLRDQGIRGDIGRRTVSFFDRFEECLSLLVDERGGSDRERSLGLLDPLVSWVELSLEEPLKEGDRTLVSAGLMDRDLQNVEEVREVFGVLVLVEFIVSVEERLLPAKAEL